MTSTYTVNKNIQKPGYNDYVSDPTGWTVPVNNDWDIIDKAFGGTTVLNPTGVSGTVNLTYTQYQSAILVVGASVSSSAVLTANVTYTIPSGVGGVWTIYNNTTGSYTITISNLGGGASVVVPQGGRITIFSDGTNIRAAGGIGGSDGQVLYNSSGAAAGSANLTFDGSYLFDAIGNVRNVPINSQTSSYTLAATDIGKLITITTGGVTVPSGIFSNGTTISIYNNSSSTQTITQGSGVTLTLVGSGTTGNRIMGAYALATIVCISSNSFLVTGGSIS